MKIKNNIKKILLAASASALVCTASVTGAMAYYTASTEKAASYTLKVTPSSTTEEELDKDGTKHVKITNTGNCPLYVRVMIIGNEGSVALGENWKQDGDWYYYTPVLEAGKTTDSEITVTVKTTDAEENFEIVVVHESCAVVFDGENNSEYPGYSLTAQSAKEVE